MLMASGPMVFLSHSSSDSAVAAAVCQSVETTGLTCWLAPRDVTPGHDYATEILGALERSALVVVLLSSSAMESPQLRREVERAASSDITLLPVRLDDTPLTTSLQYFLGSCHWIAPRGGASSVASEVARAVQRSLGREQAGHTCHAPQYGAEAELPLPLPGFRRAITPITGREPELERLLRIVDAVDTTRDASSASVGFVLIGGESGVGKSALVAAIAMAASGRGWDVASVACEPFHEGMSFFPIRELMRQLSGGGDVTAEIRRLYGASSSHAVYAAAAEMPDTPPEQRREALLATASNLIFGRFRLPNARPLLLLLDDLERIDPGSTDALLCILSRISEGPVLVIGSYRTDFVDHRGQSHPLSPLVDAIRRLPGTAVEMTLDPLPLEEFPALVEILADGPCSFPKSFYTRLYDETEGNPLFVREVLRSLQHSGSGSSILAMIDGRWRLVDGAREWDLPRSIEEAVADRLGFLGSQEREQLENAAVIGRRFSFEVMSKLVEASEEELLSGLERFIDFDLLKEIEGSDELFEFTHGKIRDVLYNAMSRVRRRRLHGRVADVLMDVAPILSEDWEALLAEHLFRAGRMSEAIPLLRRSADGLLRLFAGQEAAVQLRRALEADDATHELATGERVGVELRLVEALKLANEYEAAAEVVQKIADSDANDVAKGWAFDHLGDILWTTGDVPAAEAAYEKAEALARQSADAALLLEVYADLTELHDREAERLAGRDPERSTWHRRTSDEYLAEQLAKSEAVDDAQARARALRNEAKRRRRAGNIDEALAIYEEAIAFGDHRVATHQVLISYAKTLRYAGRRKDACAVVERVIDWSSQTGTRRSLAIALHYRAMLSLEADPPDLDAAESDLEHAVGLHADIGYLRGRCETSVSLGELALLRGDSVAMMQWFREACQAEPDVEDEAVIDLVVATLEASDEVTRAAKIRSATGRQ